MVDYLYEPDPRLADDKRNPHLGQPPGRRPPLRPAPPEDAHLLGTARAAALACRALRRTALQAVDRLTLALPVGGGARFPQHGQVSPHPRDPMSLLRACEGGVLRALRVTGALGLDGPLPLAAARALGVAPTSPGETATAIDPTVARVLGGLRALHVENASAMLDAFEQARTPPGDTEKMKRRGAKVERPSAPAPSAPLFAGLVSLSIDRFVSVYPHRTHPFRPEVPFTRAALPSLRELRLTLSPKSNCPLSLGALAAAPASSSLAAASSSPAGLTRLEVVALPHGNAFHRWAVEDPLLVDWQSFAPLAASLSVLRVDSAWHSSVYDDGVLTPSEYSCDFGDSDDLESMLMGMPPDDLMPDWEAPRWAGPTVERLKEVLEQQRRGGGGGGHEKYGGLPPELAPMVRLLRALCGATRLTRLTSLAMDADYDFAPAPTFVHAELEPQWGPVAYPNRSMWGAAARFVFAPMANTLLRLEVSTPTYGANRRGVHLPPALALLTALTSLEVAGWTLLSVGPLRRLTALRSLTLEADARPKGHAPYFPRDLAPLTRLEHLRLALAPPCLAPLIADAFPLLQTLVLREDGSAWGKGGSRASKLPSAAVLRAAQERVAAAEQGEGDEDHHGPLQVYLANDKTDWAPRGPVGADELGALAGEVTAATAATEEQEEEDRARHERRHARGLAIADMLAAMGE